VTILSSSSVDSISTATAPTEISTLSLHDALPISSNSATIPRTLNSSRPTGSVGSYRLPPRLRETPLRVSSSAMSRASGSDRARRSEEHTSELQSRENLVCRLLLEKKKKQE